MAVETRTFHIARCDVCGAAFNTATGDYWHWDDTPELALAQVEQDPGTGWVVTGARQVVCPVSDTVHYLARGGESPEPLRPSADAMAIRYTAPLLSELIADSGAA